MPVLFRIGFIEFTITDVADVLIVTSLLYGIYRLVRNTIAVQVFIGVVVLLAIYFLSEFLNLRSLNFILRAISGIWLIAFIVLFQPELRRILLYVVRLPIFSFIFSSRLNETVDEVVEAVEELSAKHIGMLLVFTRDRNIKMTIDSGVQIQGVLSKELLSSIFNPKSPLHDGAVIIQNSIVEAAGCILPLSQQAKFGQHKLGTRHRAALGIAEQADVLVVIVSEETGRISIAEEGQLEFNITTDRLRHLLSDKLIVKSQRLQQNKTLLSIIEE